MMAMLTEGLTSKNAKKAFLKEIFEINF